MKRALSVLIVGLALVWGYSELRYALASPEARVRMRIEGMALGFNTTKMAGVLGGFSKDYLDEESRIDRERVKEILLHFFFQEIDPTTKRFRLRVEIPEEQLSVVLDPADEHSALVHMRALFYEREGESERLYWDAHVTAEMRAGEDGWQIARTREVNHEARQR